MALHAPQLDDRSFQDLVDDAKRLVQQRCPEWTDHNVSDPGVTLIETFAWMTDLLLYRMNRVPDRHFVKFLDLIGVQLFPPTAATVDVTFWLSSPSAADLIVAEGTEVATLRTPDDDPINFTTTSAMTVVATELAHAASAPPGANLGPTDDDGVHNHDQALAGRKPFPCFSRQPEVGDVFLVGLDHAAPGCAVTLRVDCAMDGIGVDPTDPPLVWEAWTGNEWVRCEVERDTTGGLNRPGDVTLHVPHSHEVSVISTVRAGWLRARVIQLDPGGSRYSSSPRIDSLAAFTIGATVEAAHVATITNETLGVSEGVASQRFALQQSPVAPGRDVVVEVSDPASGWVEWTAVTTFADSGPDDRHFLLDAVSGEVTFGPVVRLEDGSLRRFGATPVKGETIRVVSYRVGGGRHANVATGAVRILRTPIPTVSHVENRRPAAGGIDGETLENAKVRGPIMLRTRNRAVTTEDYEQLARVAAPENARITAVSSDDMDGSGGAGVRVLVVPALDDDGSGRLPFDRLIPSDDSMERMRRFIDDRRTIGARISIEPPRYQGITVVAQVRARERFDADAVRDECLAALYRYFHPTMGGPDGDGWPFGRPIHVGEVYAVLQRLVGVDIIEDARLFAADPVTGERGAEAQRLVLDPMALVFSYEHRVMVATP